MKNTIKSLMLLVAFAMISQSSLISATPRDKLKGSLHLETEQSVNAWLNEHSLKITVDQDAFNKVINAFAEKKGLSQKEQWAKYATTIVEKFAQDSDSVENLKKAYDFLNRVNTDKSATLSIIQNKIASLNNVATTGNNDGNTDVDSYSSRLFGLVKAALNGTKKGASELFLTANEFGQAFGQDGLFDDDNAVTTDGTAVVDNSSKKSSLLNYISSFAKKLFGDGYSIEQELEETQKSLEETQNKITDLEKDIADLEKPGFIQKNTGYAFARTKIAQAQLAQLDRDKEYLEQKIKELSSEADPEKTITADEIKSNFSELLSTVKTNKGKTITAMLVIAFAIEEIKTGGFLTKEAYSILSKLTGWSVAKITSLLVEGEEEIGQCPIDFTGGEESLGGNVKDGASFLSRFFKRLCFWYDITGK